MYLDDILKGGRELSFLENLLVEALPFVPTYFVFIGYKTDSQEYLLKDIFMTMSYDLWKTGIYVAIGYIQYDMFTRNL
ncbi:MAG: hypothetical protein Q8R18_02355 [bacterium]|nr:hypothetical protein [bacterium]